MVNDESNQPVKSVFCANCGFAGKGIPGDECPDCHTHLIADPAAEEDLGDEIDTPLARVQGEDDEFGDPDNGGLPFDDEIGDDIPDDRQVLH